VLAQTFTDYECILVDDGSPDNCPAICDEYTAKHPQMKVIHKENGGLSDARNTVNTGNLNYYSSLKL
jgi:glycosyltransferase involved in cell wall biosynthesis